MNTSKRILCILSLTFITTIAAAQDPTQYSGVRRVEKTYDLKEKLDAATSEDGSIEIDQVFSSSGEFRPLLVERIEDNSKGIVTPVLALAGSAATVTFIDARANTSDNFDLELRCNMKHPKYPMEGRFSLTWALSYRISITYDEPVNPVMTSYEVLNHDKDEYHQANLHVYNKLDERIMSKEVNLVRELSEKTENDLDQLLIRKYGDQYFLFWNRKYLGSFQSQDSPWQKVSLKVNDDTLSDIVLRMYRTE